MGKHVRSREELEAAFAEQRRFLRRSSAAYDDGDFAEAKRLASVVYTLGHEGTGRTKSLLGQLGLREHRKFLSTARDIPSDFIPKLALASLTGLPSGKVALLPFCAMPHLAYDENWLSFSKWWEEPIFQEIAPSKPGFPLGDGRKLSRKNLVFHLRSQDGGGHYDTELRHEPYIGLAVRRRIGIYRDNNGAAEPIGDPHLASMRQIAWELEQSLKDIPGGPEIPPPEPFPPKPFRPEGPVQWDPDKLAIETPPGTTAVPAKHAGRFSPERD